MDNTNGIIRVEKHTKNFVILNKVFLEDKRLSFKSKGILTYLLSKPDARFYFYKMEATI